MQVENLIPVLDVRDVDISVEFYCDVLGFTLQDKVEWAGRTEWALLRTGKAQLMLCANQDQSDDDEQRLNEGLFFMHLDNPDSSIVRMGHRARQRGVEPEAKLGSKDFYLRDPDGYILWFSHRPPVQAQAIEDSRREDIQSDPTTTSDPTPTIAATTAETSAGAITGSTVTGSTVESAEDGSDPETGINSQQYTARHRSSSMRNSFASAHNNHRRTAS